SFSIASAHLGDISEPGHRAMAFGALTTAMGAGYTIGPLLGSQVSQHFGTRIAYLVGAGLAAAAILLTPKLLHDRRHNGSGERERQQKLLSGLRRVLRQGDVLVAAFGSLLMNISFTGAVITFFPIYGGSLHWTEATIGSLFAVRALVSTLGRLPNGVIAGKFGIGKVMAAAIAIEASAMLGIGSTRSFGLLALLIAVEGLSFGAYLVSGQAYVAERTTVEIRGAAVGLYSMTGSIGGTAGPLLLGIVAETSGVTTAFTVTGWLLAIGTVAFIASLLWLSRSMRCSEPAAQGNPELLAETTAPTETSVERPEQGRSA
ncbi:MAG TPA: MFS transporter, partial [Thermomicrobiaceae bacterium]|nr:MFS transporter [Thermomicrobiaceae bacterium]